MKNNVKKLCGNVKRLKKSAKSHRNLVVEALRFFAVAVTGSANLRAASFLCVCAKRYDADPVLALEKQHAGT